MMKKMLTALNDPQYWENKAFQEGIIEIWSSYDGSELDL